MQAGGWQRVSRHTPHASPSAGVRCECVLRVLLLRPACQHDCWRRPGASEDIPR